MSNYKGEVLQNEVFVKLMIVSIHIRDESGRRLSTSLLLALGMKSSLLS